MRHGGGLQSVGKLSLIVSTSGPASERAGSSRGSTSERTIGREGLYSWFTWLHTGSSSSRRSHDEPSSPREAAATSFNWASASSEAGLPKLLDSKGGHAGSSVMSEGVLRQLSAGIPSRFAYSDWRLLYSMCVHGISLNTLYMRTEGCGACLLVLKDRRGNVFGGFCSEWRPPARPAHFYGTGESFLFGVETVHNLPPLLSGGTAPCEVTPASDATPPRARHHTHPSYAHIPSAPSLARPPPRAY